MSARKINRIWDKPSDKVTHDARQSARFVLIRISKDAFDVLKYRNEAEGKLREIQESIEYMKAKPSSMNVSINLNLLNLNTNENLFNLLKLLKLNIFPNNDTNLITTKHKLEKYIAAYNFYLYIVKNLNEILEWFNDDEKIGIIGALLQFRDDINPYTRSIDGCRFFKHDVEKWGFIGKEADFYSNDDRISRFRDEIGEKFRLVRIDDKHTFYFDDFDLFLKIYIDEFKRAYQIFSTEK
ncbi:MAG: hypothetical protein WA130_10675 [Candidatus Methanoperedens sp.]